MDLPPLIDFHCHLDLFPDFPEQINNCEKNRIYTLAVTTTPRAWEKNKELTQNNKFVKPALGLHPQLVTNEFRNDLAVWKNHLSETKYVGEVGIDASPQYKRFLNEQIDVFEQILACCAAGGGKILSIHSVKAAATVLNCIERLLPKKCGTSVLHWFTGSLKEAKKAVDLGCYFSVNATMLQTKKGTELIKHLPTERILTETDGPFTINNGKANKPLDVINSVTLLSQLLNKSKEETKQLIFSNFRQLLNA